MDFLQPSIPPGGLNNPTWQRCTSCPFKDGQISELRARITELEQKIEKLSTPTKPKQEG